MWLTVTALRPDSVGYMDSIRADGVEPFVDKKICQYLAEVGICDISALIASNPRPRVTKIVETSNMIVQILQIC